MTKKNDERLTRDNAGGPFLLDYEKDELADLNVRIVEDKVYPTPGIWDLFVREPLHDGHIVRPRPGVPTLLIPFTAVEHHQHAFGGRTIAEVIEQAANQQLHGTKVILSGSPDKLLVLETEVYRHRIHHAICMSHASESIILTDHAFRLAFVFEYDLCVTFVAEPGSDGKTIAGLDKAAWDKYFLENFAPSRSGNQYHVDLINEYFVKNAGCPFEIKLPGTRQIP